MNAPRIIEVLCLNGTERDNITLYLREYEPYCGYFAPRTYQNLFSAFVSVLGTYCNLAALGKRNCRMKADVRRNMTSISNWSLENALYLPSW